ncbi:MAG: stage III sporulation AC/AD family protein [Corallococcus sp.]|nr:stage III sporulation AC/AD family protein [Corallococcus sp.]
MDVSIIIKIALIGLLSAVAGILLKRANRDDIATLVSIAGLILALVLVVDMLVQLFDTIRSLFDI